MQRYKLLELMKRKEISLVQYAMVNEQGKQDKKGKCEQIIITLPSGTKISIHGMALPPAELTEISVLVQDAENTEA